MAERDEMLILRAQKGDAGAFETLMAQYEKKIFNVALRTMRNREDAADMAQDAIVKIYRNLASFKGDCSFGAWAYRITLNTCLDELRRQKKRPAVSFDDMTEEGKMQFEDNSEKPEESLERKELAAVINAAIASLETDYRVAVTLRDVQGLSYQEIADATRTSLGTVKSRINRARAQLQKKILPYRERFQ